jgi:hypothetical protein
LVDDRLAGRAHARGELGLRQAEAMSHPPDLVGIVGRNLTPGQWCRSFLRPRGSIEIRMSERLRIGERRTRTQSTKRRPRVVSNTQAAVLGRGVQSPHVDVNQARQRLEG